MTNLVRGLLDSARRAPSSPAVRADDELLSYGELELASRRVATMLRERGVKPGDRIGVMLPNVSAFPVAYYGILLAGGVVVPMNPLLKEREVSYYLADSGARVLFAWHEVAEEATAGAGTADCAPVIVDPQSWHALLTNTDPATEVTDRADEDTAVILYTSGTTGKPKGAELTHFNLRRNAEVFSRQWLELTADDVMIGCLPLFHTFGQTVSMNCAIFTGASLTLIPRFTAAKALDVIARDGVSIFVGVPTMYSAMLEDQRAERYDTSSLRLCCSGGAPLPVELLGAFEERFGCVIIEGYGLSETSPVCCFNPPGGQRKPGSVGLPLQGVDIRVVSDDGEGLAVDEIGEICIRGENVMKGYLGRPDATAEVLIDGWFYTGDVGRIDEDGYLFIVDRKKALIIRGGYNVYPREIEEVLYEHPDIVEAAVIGVPHPALGEEVGAAVVLRAGTTSTAQEVRAFVKDRVAAYKYPREVWVVDELPKGPTGKILRREVTRPEAIR